MTVYKKSNESSCVLLSVYRLTVDKNRGLAAEDAQQIIMYS